MFLTHMTCLNCAMIWNSGLNSMRLVEDSEDLEERLHFARSDLYNNWAQLSVELSVGAVHCQVTVITSFSGFAVAQCKYVIKDNGVRGPAFQSHRSHLRGSEEHRPVLHC